MKIYRKIDACLRMAEKCRGDDDPDEQEGRDIMTRLLQILKKSAEENDREQCKKLFEETFAERVQTRKLDIHEADKTVNEFVEKCVCEEQKDEPLKARLLRMLSGEEDNSEKTDECMDILEVVGVRREVESFEDITIRPSTKNSRSWLPHMI